MNTIDKFKVLLKKINEAKLHSKIAEGEIKKSLSILKKHNIKTPKEAEAKIKQLDQEIIKNEIKLNKYIEEMEKTLNNYANE